jgi:hypothetical protein
MRRKGPWSSDRIERFLRESRIPLRIACNGASGHPLIASLWFVPLGGRLWCATQRTASLVSCLARDPRCAFEVSLEAPPYRGVRGRGAATLHRDRGEEILRLLIQRYQGGATTKLARLLLARADREIAISIEPRTLVSWDYTDRMGEAA